MNKDRMAITSYTPASIAAWESSLASRTELCVSLAGTPEGKLTLYAGPNATGSEPIAVLDLPGSGIYLSRPATGSTEHWITEMLHAVEELTHPAPVHAMAA